MARRKKKLTNDERRLLREAFEAIRADVVELRALLVAASQSIRETEAEENRRRARLRPLAFGLLGR